MRKWQWNNTAFRENRILQVQNSMPFRNTTTTFFFVRSGTTGQKGVGNLTLGN